MGALKSNFLKKRPDEAPNADLRAEFERKQIAAGAKGSFMVFVQKKDEEPVFAESSL